MQPPSMKLVKSHVFITLKITTLLFLKFEIYIGLFVVSITINNNVVIYLLKYTSFNLSCIIINNNVVI